MRKAIIFAVAGLLACVALAEWHEETVTVAHTGTDAALYVTQDVSVVKGELVGLHVVLATATNVDIDITLESDVPSADSVTLYSADDVDADAWSFPVFDRNDSSGSALGSDEPAPRPVVGDTVRVVGSDWAVTTGVFRVKVVWKE